MNKNCLAVTSFLDHDHPRVREFAESSVKGLTEPLSQAVRLFEVVRDRFEYNPYRLNLTKEAMKASSILTRPYAYCNEKALVLAAALRHLGIPTRLYFGNVRNHIATERLQMLIKTDVMAFHGATEIFLDGKWLKATPAFNSSLCRKLRVEPLVFDGLQDAVFQEFGEDGQKFMEYIEVHGSFEDMPYDLFLSELRKHYSHLLAGSQDLNFDLTALAFSTKPST